MIMQGLQKIHNFLFCFFFIKYINIIIINLKMLDCIFLFLYNISKKGNYEIYETIKI